MKKIKEIQTQFDSKLTETAISQILYEFNMIWRDIMRKENQAIKRKFTLQVQDLRRQLVTKKAFDEDASAREISRLKKEIAFLNASVYNQKRSSYSKTKETQDMPSESSRQAKAKQMMRGFTGGAAAEASKEGLRLMDAPTESEGVAAMQPSQYGGEHE